MSADRPPAIAVIDIGTNSVKLLVGRVDRDGIETIRFARSTTRLGRALSARRRISRSGLDATASAVLRFTRAAARSGAERVFGFSTYSLRRASNARDVVRALRSRTGVDVRVLTGREEARFAYLSARRCLRRPRPSTLVVDVGGGSTECALGCRGRIEVARSLPLGALHLTESFLHSDPVTDDDYAAMSRRIGTTVGRFAERLPPLAPGTFDLVASGGAPATAAWMAGGFTPGTASGASISMGQIRGLERSCRPLTVAQRRRLPGLPADRADIILAGLAIVTAVMERVRKRRLRINEGGAREGALIHLTRNNLRW